MVTHSQCQETQEQIKFPLLHPSSSNQLITGSTQKAAEQLVAGRNPQHQKNQEKLPPLTNDDVQVRVPLIRWHPLGRHLQSWSPSACAGWGAAGVGPPVATAARSSWPPPVAGGASAGRARSGGAPGPRGSRRPQSG